MWTDRRAVRVGESAMNQAETAAPQARKLAVERTLQATENATSTADLRLLAAWETNRSMHFGIMFRIRQIRRANPQLSAKTPSE
jgi:hypothetical protein